MAKKAETTVNTTEKKKTRRTSDERIAEIDKKIAAHEEAIAKLKEKKETILHPKVRISKAAQLRLLLNKAKESGLSNEEIAEKLGIDFK